MVNRISDDPCFNEHEASLKCLDKNNYDGKQCEDLFEAYRACRKRTAAEIVAERRRNNAEGKMFEYWFGKKKTPEDAQR